MTIIYQDTDPKREDIPFGVISPAIEFMGGAVVLLTSVLLWVNGAAVTTDQFCMQVALFSTALTGAVRLRVFHLLRGQQSDP